MRENIQKTNQYAVAFLKDRRATRAGEIQQFKQVTWSPICSRSEVKSLGFLVLG